MTAYDLLRLALGIAQLAVAWLVWHRSAGYICFSFLFAMFGGGVYAVAPAYPQSELWKQGVQVPIYAALLAFTIASTIDVYAFLRRRTFPRERWLLLAFACALGAAVVAAGWWWHPTNWYQSIMLIRQYTLIGLCMGNFAAWYWVSHARPVPMEAQTEAHGVLWCVWLVCAALASSTTTGGLWRLASPMTTGAMWREMGCFLMAAQILVCAGFALNLRRWRIVVQPSSDGGRVLQG